ncbi:MAG: hypothetical protein ABIJ97_03150 [Bacteroidota bacterium]
MELERINDINNGCNLKGCSKEVDIKFSAMTNNKKILFGLCNRHGMPVKENIKSGGDMMRLQHVEGVTYKIECVKSKQATKITGE